MSDKKITELQLRSNVNDDVNFPADDGIQTYRVTAPQLEAYISALNRDPRALLNYSLVASVAGSALTIALKNAAGNNPSSTSPCVFGFRNATAATGDFSIVKATAATSLVISSGSTLGTVSGVESDVYIYAINNGGTIELAASLSRMWAEESVQSTTSEGGSGAADAADVLYSTTARSNKAVRLIGKIKSTQATAGTWASAPSEISLKPISESPFELHIGPNCTSYGADTNTSYAVLNNSPTMTFTPNRSGLFKVYANGQVYNPNGTQAYFKITNTSGGATLIKAQESIAGLSSGSLFQSTLIFSIFRLVAGVSYVFDISGYIDTSGTFSYRGDQIPYNLFAERIGD